MGNPKTAAKKAEIEPERVRNFVRNYEGPPLTLHVLTKMRDVALGETE